MNLVSYVILAVIIVCFVLAVRYTRKHGSCEACGGGCAVSASNGGCPAGCTSCSMGSCTMPEDVHKEKKE